MHKLTATYYWLENKHTKKLFKKRSEKLGEEHKIINNSFSCDIVLHDPDYAHIPTELAAVISVNRRYATFYASIHIYSLDMVSLRKAVVDTDPPEYRYIRYAYLMDVNSSSSTFWLKQRGEIFESSEIREQKIKTYTHMEYTLANESVHNYMRIMPSLPDIAKEIQTNLMTLK